MNNLAPSSEQLINQHLIDPDRCVRCACCESICPTEAISHVINFVVDPDKCNGCGACTTDCPTGAANSWRLVSRDQLYTVEQQLHWDTLPPVR